MIAKARVGSHGQPALGPQSRLRLRADLGIARAQNASFRNTSTTRYSSPNALTSVRLACSGGVEQMPLHGLRMRLMTQQQDVNMFRTSIHQLIRSAFIGG